MMIEDANTQRRTTEKSTTPLGGILVTHIREPSLFTESRMDEEDSDRNFAFQPFSEVSLGLNASTTFSVAEKSRKDYIYVSYFFLSF